jgi:DNA-binding transcriptional ArsR family regulator
MDAFEAVAEPNRRRILDLLRCGERPAGDLVERLAISQPNASKHLRLLREAGLVSVRADGQRRIYKIEPDRLAELESWLAPYRGFWRWRLDALDRHLDGEN